MAKILALLCAVIHLVGAAEVEKTEAKLRGANAKPVSLETLPDYKGMGEDPPVVPAKWKLTKDWQTPAIAFGFIFGVPIFLIPLMIRMKTIGDPPLREMIMDMLTTFFCIFATLPVMLMPSCRSTPSIDIPYDDYPNTWHVHWEEKLYKAAKKMGSKKFFDKSGAEFECKFNVENVRCCTKIRMYDGALDKGQFPLTVYKGDKKPTK
jgi:hypothetical protein